ncbi:hypothetical protein Pelo_7345 [Pelomyxa schiedti]|nr:hypothetical protein Pelo_7345 [Pelomyxa schiedti]
MSLIDPVGLSTLVGSQYSTGALLFIGGATFSVMYQNNNKDQHSLKRRAAKHSTPVRRREVVSASALFIGTIVFGVSCLVPATVGLDTRMEQYAGTWIPSTVGSVLFVFSYFLETQTPPAIPTEAAKHGAHVHNSTDNHGHTKQSRCSGIGTHPSTMVSLGGSAFFLIASVLGFWYEGAVAQRWLISAAFLVGSLLFVASSIDPLVRVSSRAGDSDAHFFQQVGGDRPPNERL